MKAIRTIADLSNAWARQNAATAKLRSRPYVARPALQQYLDSFDNLKTVSDPDERFGLFRKIPAFEYHLKRFHDALTPQQRTSFAQQARAQKPRLKITADGKTMRRIVTDLCLRADNGEKITKQLWPLLFDDLCALKLNPIKFTDERDTTKELIRYDAGSDHKTITERRFANIVSSVRRRARAVN
jgi:hypothetical protein